MQDIKENKTVNFPMNSHKDFMQDKKVDYKTLAIMTLHSNFTDMEKQHETGVYENYRYIYKNKIIGLTEEIEALSKNKINTIIKNMRKLSQLNNGLVTACKNKNDDIYYVINYCNGDTNNKFVTIEESMLKFLINAGNSNMIKVYILIKYLCLYQESLNGEKEKRITLGYICQQIGLSPKSNNNLNIITDIVTSLENNKFINRRKVNKQGVKTIIFYSINSYEYWKENIKNN